eukprot:447545_1
MVDLNGKEIVLVEKRIVLVEKEIVLGEKEITVVVAPFMSGVCLAVVGVFVEEVPFMSSYARPQEEEAFESYYGAWNTTQSTATAQTTTKPSKSCEKRRRTTQRTATAQTTAKTIKKLGKKE